MNITGKQEYQNRIANRDCYLISGLILAGIGVRLFMWYWTESSFLGDMIHYVDIAKDIGDGYIRKAFWADTTPLYPLLIQGVYLFVRDYDISARLVNVIFGGLLVYPLFQMAYLVYGRRIAVMVGCLVVFAGEFINYSLSGYAESTYLFFITMAFYKVVKAIRLKSNREIFWSGLFFGLTFLIKKQAMVFIPLTLLWVFMVLTIEKKKVSIRGIYGVIFLIAGYWVMVAPYHYIQIKGPGQVGQQSSNKPTHSTLESTYSIFSRFNLLYEKDYMKRYVLHRDQNGYYYLGGVGPGEAEGVGDFLSAYLPVLGSRFIEGLPNIANRLFPLAIVFFLIGLIKKDWDLRVEGYLLAIIIINIMATSLYYWNPRYLNTSMPVVLLIGASGIVRAGTLLGGLTSRIVPLFKEWGFDRGGKGWVILLTAGVLVGSLVMLLLQEPDYPYIARIRHQKKVAEQLKAKFGTNLKIMNWGIGRSAISYYMGLRLSQVRIIPIASMEMIMGYARQEGVELLVFDTEEIRSGRAPGIIELLEKRGRWPGLQLVMVSPRGGYAIFVFKVL